MNYAAFFAFRPGAGFGPHPDTRHSHASIVRSAFPHAAPPLVGGSGSSRCSLA